MNYATIEKLEKLWRNLTEDETTRASELIKLVSSEIRVRAKRKGINMDRKVEMDEDFAEVTASVVCDIVARTLMTSTNQEPMTQFSQTAGSYSVSGTFLVPGGGLFIKKSEWKRLGLTGQTFGWMEIYDQGN